MKTSALPGGGEAGGVTAALMYLLVLLVGPAQPHSSAAAANVEISNDVFLRVLMLFMS